MKRRWLVGLLIVAMAATSCSFDPATADPEDIDECDDLGAALVALVEEYVGAVERQPIDVLLDSASPPAELAALIERGGALGERAPVIGCAQSDLIAVMTPGLTEITPEGLIGERYLNLVLEAIGLGSP